MKHFIDLKRDRFGWWLASFEDSPHETYGGFSPRAALRSLFACNPHRQIDESRVIAMDPVSPTHLRFRVKTRVERPALARSR